MSSAYTASPRTTPTRHKERVGRERETVHRILDEGWVCHLGFIADGRPVVLPTVYARVGERLYLHGSTGSRPLRAAAGEEESGMPVCVTVTLVDGLVLAKSAFNHSANFRSVVAHGDAYTVTDPDERRAALDAIVDHVVPGRSGEVRPPTAKELAQTAVLRLDLDEVTSKVRAGAVADEDEDRDLPHWSGIVPLATVPGTPVPADDCTVPVPEHVRALAGEGVSR